MRRLAGIIVCWGLALASPGDAQTGAEAYPAQPIKIVVPFPAGGSVDILARAVGQKLQERWGQPVLVDNRPGASTTIGTGVVAKAPPDGYTLVIVVSNHATNPALYKELAYDTATAFAPVTLMARASVVALAHPSLPATDLAGLAAVAKTRPGGVAYGSAGIGSMTHLTAELLKADFGFALDHVPYKGGASALNDLLGGQIQLQFATVSQGLPYLQGGQVRALGITSAARSRALPDVPTFKEQGLDMTVIEWYGLLAPAGTPQPIVAKLNAEVRRILALPDLGERVSSVELVGSTPEELAEFMRGETERWGALIRRLGLKVD